MVDIEKLVTQLRWKYAVVSGGQELLIETCPYCGAPKHFYINRQDGRFHCKKVKCGARGGLYQLQLLARKAVPVDPATVQPVPTYDRTLLHFEVETWHRDLWQHKTALNYLTKERKFTNKAIMHFKLGVINEYGKEWITFPYIHKNKISTVKYRRLDQKQYRHLRNTDIGLYHAEALDGTNKEVIVTEGEADTVALWSYGFKNVVGLPGAGQWKPEWMDQFSPFDKIYLCLDSDDAGQLAAKELAKKFGYDRCYAVQLPLGIKDANDLFVSSTKGIKKFRRILGRAKAVDVPYVIRAGDSIRNIILRDRVLGDATALTTPWPELNRILGGIVPESLVFLTSHSGVGKSTMALQWMYHLVKEGRPIGYVCIEMSSDEMTKRLLNLHTRTPTQTPEEKIAVMQEIGEYPFYWIDLAKHASARFDVLAETLRDAVPRYGLQMIVVDHFHFMVRSVKYIIPETGKLAQSFKLLARELGIPIICIAHVTKPILRADGTPKRVVGSDLRDSGLLYADADYVFVLHRKPLGNPVTGEWDGEWDDKVEIALFKSRHSEKSIIRNLTFYGSIGLIT